MKKSDWQACWPLNQIFFFHWIFNRTKKHHHHHWNKNNVKGRERYCVCIDHLNYANFFLFVWLKSKKRKKKVPGIFGSFFSRLSPEKSVNFGGHSRLKWPKFFKLNFSLWLSNKAKYFKMKFFGRIDFSDSNSDQKRNPDSNKQTNLCCFSRKKYWLFAILPLMTIINDENWLIDF